MSWNYRVVHRVAELLNDSTIEDVYLIEAYYDDAGRLNGYCDATPGGADLDDLRADLTYMLAALDAPVIEESDLPTSKESTK